ncbi:MAG: carboxypeptidase regulatory-like domain-containing protein [Acidobacteriia bacterium]|nr:carboxypeptidase regulatory-like domain-containing protein [Terriglobia bacterium]
MRVSQRLWVVLALGLLCPLMIGTAAAQSDRGSIAGSVVDSTGAAVSGAAITIKGADTGSVYQAVSSGVGSYRVNDLAIGRYDVTVEAKGFKMSVQKGVVIEINSVSALNITLHPGNVKEEVTVLADAPTIQTESSEVGTVIGDKQIHDLPLMLNTTGQSGGVRSPETFIFLTPGTTGQGTVGDHGAAGIYETKISGGQNFGSEILLDGVSTQRSDSGTAFDQTAPSVEALTEFKVTSSTPSSEFGHTSGGVESFTTKSGTNSFHGSLFELYHNEAMNARPWACCGPVIKVPRDRQNDFGGALGGPVWIPHLYDGKNKTFFFFAWEQYRNKVGLQNSILTLPTADERGGDFSALLGTTVVGTNPCDGQPVLQGQIFDPSTTQVVGGQTCRLPFAGNKITNISPVAQKVLGYLPATNLSGSPLNGVPGLSQNYQNPAGTTPKVITQTSFRIDENLTNKNKMFFSYHSREQNILNSGNFDLPAPLTPDTYFNHYFTHYVRFGWDYVASPTVLNHFAAGLNRVWTATAAPSVNGSDWEKVLGIAGASGPTFPQIRFDGAQYGLSYAKFSASNYGLQIPNALVVADSVSWNRGPHSFKFGFDWRSYQYSIENTGPESPYYVFNSRETGFVPPGQNANASNTGDPFASFLLGLPDQGSLSVTSHFSRWIQNYYAAFVQDDFKARRNLTVNLGLRWDINTPRHEATGAQSVLSLTATNPASSGQPGALIYGRSATGAKTYYKALGPRIGFAYSPDRTPGTVFRGAYSIYYAPLTYSDFGGSLSSGTTANPGFQNVDNFTPIQSWDVGFPSYPAPSNTQDPTLTTFSPNPGGPNFVASGYGRPGMVQNWTFQVQHQLAPDLIMSLGYVGQHATRLLSNLTQVNALNPQYFYLGDALNDRVDGSDGKNGPTVLAQLGKTVPSWFVPGWGSGNATIAQLLRPFPQYSNITTSCCLENSGQSTYHALQAVLERRFRNGLNLLASYTFSKTITDADTAFPVETGFNSNVFGAQNPYNLKGEKSVSYQDIPHTFVISYLYELPMGHGKKYLNHGVASKVAGGWQVSAIQRYQAGSPAIINEYATSAPSTANNFRFSLIPGQSVFGPHPVQWTPALDNGWNSGCHEVNGIFQSNYLPGTGPGPVNCAAFADPSALNPNPDGSVSQYRFGNLPTAVSWWRSPGFNNEDVSVIKRTTVHEGQSILVKFDIQNVFNRHTFGGIDGNPFDSFFGVAGGGGHSVINNPRTIQATIRYEF